MFSVTRLPILSALDEIRIHLNWLAANSFFAFLFGLESLASSLHCGIQEPSSPGFKLSWSRKTKPIQQKNCARQNECQWHSGGLFTAIAVKCQMVGPAGRRGWLAGWERICRCLSLHHSAASLFCVMSGMGQYIRMSSRIYY